MGHDFHLTTESSELLFFDKQLLLLNADILLYRGAILLNTNSLCLQLLSNKGFINK